MDARSYADPESSLELTKPRGAPRGGPCPSLDAGPRRKRGRCVDLTRRPRRSHPLGETEKRTMGGPAPAFSGRRSVGCADYLTRESETPSPVRGGSAAQRPGTAPPSPLWGGSRAKRAGWGSKWSAARTQRISTPTPTPIACASLRRSTLPTRGRVKERPCRLSTNIQRRFFDVARMERSGMRVGPIQPIPRPRSPWRRTFGSPDIATLRKSG